MKREREGERDKGKWLFCTLIDKPGDSLASYLVLRLIVGTITFNNALLLHQLFFCSNLDWNEVAFFFNTPEKYLDLIPQVLLLLFEATPDANQLFFLY